MLDHVSITVSDLSRARPFYDAILSALDIPSRARTDAMLGYGHLNTAVDDSHSYLTVRLSTSTVHPDNRHWCLRAPSRAAVHAFHAAGLAAGGRCNGPPGLRPVYHGAYYAAFLLDHDGNHLEAVCHRVPA